MSRRNTSREVFVRKPPEKKHWSYPAGEQELKADAIEELALDKLVDDLGSDETPDTRSWHNDQMLSGPERENESIYGGTAQYWNNGSKTRTYYTG